MTTLTRKATIAKFESEEVASDYGYFSGYKKPKAIARQVTYLRQLLPKLGSADEKLAEENPPPNAEGWFAIPRWEKISPIYHEAVKIVLDLIKETRNGNFYIHREGKLFMQYLRQHESTVAAIKRFGKEQKKHDILVIPAQFGLRHRGRSVRRARETMKNVSEFGLGAFHVAIMILTHPERLEHYRDLWIDCAGDGYAPGSVCCSSAPCFKFSGSGVGFDSDWFDLSIDHYGSASGFVLRP
ncbi:hypothetical protein IID26_00030 [Patescibacteria group bacterium]|nr:hypothetical protein [Patescibacteria group bacterium]